MFKIALVNLPFAAYHLPSIGLTQLKAVVDQQYGGEVETRVLYANMDFANYMGFDLYDTIASSGEHLQSGFSEWFFREIAFPGAADNIEAYFARYYPGNYPGNESFRKTILEKRRGLGAMLDTVIERYDLAHCDIVGFTSMFFENMVSTGLARKLKARNPRLVTVLGGATSESPAGEELIRYCESLDYVFSGPALKTFPRFIGNCLRGEMELNDKIDGVFSRANLGRGVGPMGEELDINVPIPLDYGPFIQVLDEKFPAYEMKVALPFETSRGCWWGEHAHCTFCGLNKSTMNYRAMRPDLAVELIRSLFKFADRTSVIMCVDNILQRQYVKEVFPYLDTPENTAIFYQLKANLTERELEAMSRARVKLVTPGFESLSTATLKLMDKGVTAFQNIQVMKYCRLHDVHPGWNLLLGSPGEGEETYAKYCEELHRLVHLPAPQGIFSIHFNRYSPYFTRAKEYGLDLKPLDYYEMVYPFPKEAIDNLAYDFTDHNFGADYMLALSKWIDRVKEKVQYWQRRQSLEDGLPEPKLFFRERDGQTFIYDSRSGRPTEYPITPVVRRLLEHLNEPRRLFVLPSELRDVAGLDLDRDIEFLREHELLFQEGERIMSLVFPRDPSPMSYRSRALGVHKKLKETDVNALLEPAMGPIARAARRVVRPGAVKAGA
jgi:ribosomal peptide maturation radical SAM protein 1